MELWLDPFVRKTCGDAINAAPGLAMTLLKRGHVHDPAGAAARVTAGLQPVAAPGELAPGLPLDGLVLAAAREIEDGGVASSKAAELLRVVSGYLRAAGPGAAAVAADRPLDSDAAVLIAMRGMGLARRAALALAIASEPDYEVESWGGMGARMAARGGEDGPGKAVLECFRLTLQAACVCGGPGECVRLMQAAAAGVWLDDDADMRDDDDNVIPLCAVGRMSHGRAALQWCLRLCSVADAAPDAALDATAVMRDVPSAVRGYHDAGLPNKTGATAAARAAADEKLLCLNLVQPPDVAEKYRRRFGAGA